MLGFSTEITDIKENQEFTEEKPIFLQEAMIIKQKFISSIVEMCLIEQLITAHSAITYYTFCKTSMHTSIFSIYILAF